MTDPCKYIPRGPRAIRGVAGKTGPLGHTVQYTVHSTQYTVHQLHCAPATLARHSVDSQSTLPPLATSALFSPAHGERNSQNSTNRLESAERHWPSVFSKFVFRWECKDPRDPDHGKTFVELIEPLAGMFPSPPPLPLFFILRFFFFFFLLPFSFPY